MTEAEFLSDIQANPANVALLARLRAIGLPDCHLTAGCLFQTVWNRRSGRAADWGIKDYDVFYFDDRDLIACTCVGISAEGGTLYAPDGLHDLARGVLRMNPLNPNPALFREKAANYRSRWPWLSIMN